MAEKIGNEVELTDNLFRDQMNMAFEKDRFAVKLLISLVNVDKDDYQTQRKLSQAIFDTSEFETTYRMAMNDDFKLVAQNPRVPYEEED